MTMPCSLLSFLLAAAAWPANEPMDSAPTIPLEAYSSGAVAVEGGTVPYQLLAPDSIRSDERYPLVLFLHGAGERGDDNVAQLTHFPERMRRPEYRERYPCFVLAPQCPKGARWVETAWGAETSEPMAGQPSAALAGAIAALEEVVARYPIDTQRIYVTGLSMGGFGTFEVAMRHADWFAAAAPVCGGGDEREIARLAGLPLSVWHGDADTAIPVGRSRVLVEALRALGESPQYHELPGVGHNAWDTAYDEGGVLDWLFEERRDPRRRLDAAARLMAESLRPEEHLAFLGDSITQAGARPGGYVDLLRGALEARRPEAVVIPAGISGHKVPDLVKREERDVRSKNATLVFVYIGINDVWHSQSGRGTPRDVFQAQLRGLLETLEGPGGATTVMGTATVIGERRAGENPLDELLADFVGIEREIAAGRTLCDLHQAFRDHLTIFNTANAKEGILTYDGVHLTEAGNVLVATEAAHAIRRAALNR